MVGPSVFVFDFELTLRDSGLRAGVGVAFAGTSTLLCLAFVQLESDVPADAANPEIGRTEIARASNRNRRGKARMIVHSGRVPKPAYGNDGQGPGAHVPESRSLAEAHCARERARPVHRRCKRRNSRDRVTGNDPAIERQFVNMEPMGRMGTPQEIAEAAVWLCSPAASFITGQALAIDGGLVAR